MTHSSVCHYSLNSVSSFIQPCVVTHSIVCRDSFDCVSWRSHSWYTHAYCVNVYVRKYVYTCHIYMRIARICIHTYCVNMYTLVIYTCVRWNLYTYILRQYVYIHIAYICIHTYGKNLYTYILRQYVYIHIAYVCKYHKWTYIAYTYIAYIYIHDSWHDSCICRWACNSWLRHCRMYMSWLIYTCAMTHSRMWHDSSTCRWAWNYWLCQCQQTRRTWVRRHGWVLNSLRVGAGWGTHGSPVSSPRNEVQQTRPVQWLTPRVLRTHEVNCNALQHTVIHCTILQHIVNTTSSATWSNRCRGSWTFYTLQQAATRCSTLQHTATHCNTQQHAANTTSTATWSTGAEYPRRRPFANCNTLHHTATHCNTLQHTAIHCNTLPIRPLQWLGPRINWPCDSTMLLTFENSPPFQFMSTPPPDARNLNSQKRGL